MQSKPKLSHANLVGNGLDFRKGLGWIAVQFETSSCQEYFIKYNTSQGCNLSQVGLKPDLSQIKDGFRYNSERIGRKIRTCWPLRRGFCCHSRWCCLCGLLCWSRNLCWNFCPACGSFTISQDIKNFTNHYLERKGRMDCSTQLCSTGLFPLDNETHTQNGWITG